MAKYLLLLRDDPNDFGDLSPAEMQGIIAKYSAWNERLRAEGKLVDSQKLADGEGRVLRGGGDALRVTDGPYSETKEVVGGFFVLEADSYDDAVEITRDCPHLDFDGAVELRRVEEV